MCIAGYFINFSFNNQTSGSVRSLYYNSLAIHGPRLFNSTPATIQNLINCSVDTFKRYLDKYLRMVPDEPQISGYTALRRAKSNKPIRYGPAQISLQLLLLLAVAVVEMGVALVAV